MACLGFAHQPTNLHMATGMGVEERFHFILVLFLITSTGIPAPLILFITSGGLTEFQSLGPLLNALQESGPACCRCYQKVAVGYHDMVLPRLHHFTPVNFICLDHTCLFQTRFLIFNGILLYLAYPGMSACLLHS